MLREVREDLFNSPDSLAHCVSSCFTMGKGIAYNFKMRFGKVEELKTQDKNVGEVAYIYDETSKRYIFYLITKEWYCQKPTYVSLRNSLVSLKNILKELKITELSIPKIGCGLDRLNWNEVKLILTEVFINSNVNITVYCV